MTVRELSVSRRDHLLGGLLAAVYLVALLATAQTLGFCRDEGFYFQAARDYQGWFDVLATNPAAAFTRASIEKYWSYNHEHPALMKVLFGFSERLFHTQLGWLSASTAERLPGMLSGAGIIYLLFVWGTGAFGRTAGAFAAMAYALLPRDFYHAHLACFDTAITFCTLLVCYLYYRSLTSVRFGIAAGAAFGVALCVKLNAFFLPFVLGAHFLALLLYRWRQPVAARGPRPKPHAFLAGLVLAPLIFFAHWPWLWIDTSRHLLAYAGFHSGHPHYNTAWFGENVFRAPTPILLPIGMTLFTVPSVLVLLTAIGLFMITRRHLPQSVETRLAKWLPGSPNAPNHGHDLLLILNAVFPIALISLPSVPVFGGTKHWMPAYPFWMLLAGSAAALMLTRLTATLGTRLARAGRVALFVIVLLPPCYETVTSHPFGLESYVPFIGGAPGAADLGLTRQFWGYTTLGVLPFLGQTVAKGGKVFFHDTSPPAVRMFAEEGRLRSDIRSTRIQDSDFALVHHELHMIVVEADIWSDYGTLAPTQVLTYQGVPIVSVYRRD